MTRFHPHKAVQPEIVISNRPVSPCFFFLVILTHHPIGQWFIYNKQQMLRLCSSRKSTVNDLRRGEHIVYSKELLLCNSSQKKTTPGVCVCFRQAGLSECHVRQLPQCPGGRRPPEGCRKRGSGMASAKGEPGVWPCSCAARWRVHSGRPQSGNTFPLSPGCKTRCNCPEDKRHTGGSEKERIKSVFPKDDCVFSMEVWLPPSDDRTFCYNSHTVSAPSSSRSLTFQPVSSPASSTPLWR